MPRAARTGRAGTRAPPYSALRFFDLPGLVGAPGGVALVPAEAGVATGVPVVAARVAGVTQASKATCSEAGFPGGFSSFTCFRSGEGVLIAAVTPER